MPKSKNNSIQKIFQEHRTVIIAVLRFGAIFSIALACFFAAFNSFDRFFSDYFLRPVAESGFHILSLFTSGVTFEGQWAFLGYCNYILPEQVLQVNYGCTGIYVLFILLSAIVAYPAPVRRILSGLALSTVLFFVYSIIRLAIMGLTGYYFSGILTIAHDYLMVLFNTIFVLFIYKIWIDNRIRITNLNFFIRLPAYITVLFIMWIPLTSVYKHILSGASNILFNITGFPVDAFILYGEFKLRYPSFNNNLIQFTVNDIGQIFLNIIILIALFASSYKVAIAQRLKHFAVSGLLLLFIQAAVIYFYAHTTIWEFVGSLPENLQASATVYASGFSSQDSISTHSRLLFFWNSWGWDLTPLLLWVPTAIGQGLFTPGRYFPKKKDRRWCLSFD